MWGKTRKHRRKEIVGGIPGCMEDRSGPRLSNQINAILVLLQVRRVISAPASVSWPLRRHFGSPCVENIYQLSSDMCFCF